MREDILRYLEEEVSTRCGRVQNFFGMGILYHIKAVVQNAIRLAEEYGADVEIVALAAWLHDIAAITDYQYYEEHHVWGSKMAGELLEQFNYPAQRIEWVQRCILNHRGSVLREKSTVEEICVADADAISHFDSVPSLLYLAFVQRGYSLEEGTSFVADKLRRSYQKLSDSSKALYLEKYDAVMRLVSTS